MHMARRIATLVLLAAVAAATGHVPVSHSPAHAQTPGEAPVWTTYTNANAVWSVAVDPTTREVWTAASGGVVRWSPDTGTYAKFTTVDGLLDNDARTIEIDPVTGARWIGTTGGVSVFGTDGRWTTYLQGREIRGIAFDSARGEVWIAASDGAWRLVQRFLSNLTM